MALWRGKGCFGLHGACKSERRIYIDTFTCVFVCAAGCCATCYVCALCGVVRRRACVCARAAAPVPQRAAAQTCCTRPATLVPCTREHTQQVGVRSRAATVQQCSMLHLWGLHLRPQHALGHSATCGHLAESGYAAGVV